VALAKESSKNSHLPTIADLALTVNYPHVFHTSFVNPIICATRFPLREMMIFPNIERFSGLF